MTFDLKDRRVSVGDTVYVTPLWSFDREDLHPQHARIVSETDAQYRVELSNGTERRVNKAGHSTITEFSKGGEYRARYEVWPSRTYYEAHLAAKEIDNVAREITLAHRGTVPLTALEGHKKRFAQLVDEYIEDITKLIEEKRNW